MIFSFIIPYRNRELIRVKNCLESIQNQVFKDFEIIFIDYGSDLEIRTSIESLCKQFAQLKYFYFDTRYQFWSRSHALNLGIQKAEGNFLVVVDIDLLYSPTFLDSLKAKIDKNSFVQYQCYYLPEHITDYEKLDFQKPYPYPVSSTNMAAGLIAFPKEKIEEIGGFDEYFKVWGVEDIDLKKRLQNINLIGKVLSINESATFHQWHPSASQEDSMPALWLTAMEKYAKNKSLTPLPYLGKQVNFQRPALDLMFSKQEDSYFTFEYPTLQSFVKFSQLFYSLNAGDFIIVNQSFTIIKTNEKSRLGKLFSKTNHLLEKFRVSYRVAELFTFETELVNFINIRDFLFYFIAENEDYIADYAFDNVHLQQIKCILVKA